MMKEMWQPEKKELESVLFCGNLAERLTEEPEFRAMLLSLDPAVAAMDMPQHTPFHDYTVLMHTAHAVDAVSPEGLSEEEYRLLKTAAFFSRYRKAGDGALPDRREGISPDRIPRASGEIS